MWLNVVKGPRSLSNYFSKNDFGELHGMEKSPSFEYITWSILFGKAAVKRARFENEPFVMSQGALIGLNDVPSTEMALILSPFRLSDLCSFNRGLWPADQPYCFWRSEEFHLFDVQVHISLMHNMEPVVPNWVPYGCMDRRSSNSHANHSEDKSGHTSGLRHLPQRSDVVCFCKLTEKNANECFCGTFHLSTSATVRLIARN